MLQLPKCPENYYIAIEVEPEDVHEFLDSIYDIGYKWAGEKEPDEIEALVSKRNLISLEDNKIYYSPKEWYVANQMPKWQQYGYIFVDYKDLIRNEVSFDDIDQILSGKEEYT